MNIDTEQPYTVLSPEYVQDALDLNYAPQGLNVSPIDEQSCKVKVIPPGKHTREIRVSNTLLQELLENEHIEKKL